MSCILLADEDDHNKKINLDDLYQRQQQRDLKQLSIFNKILNRAYKRISTTNRMKRNDRHIWFAVPDFIFGEPIYDCGDCIGYLVTKLKDNGFFIKYMHPNTLFISWEHWVPTYKINEIKKKTGLILNHEGAVVDQLNMAGPSPDDINSGVVNARNVDAVQAKKKEYTPIQQYKPTGNLVYNRDLFEKLEKKVSFS